MTRRFHLPPHTISMIDTQAWEMVRHRLSSEARPLLSPSCTISVLCGSSAGVGTTFLAMMAAARLSERGPTLCVDGDRLGCRATPDAPFLSSLVQGTGAEIWRRVSPLLCEDPSGASVLPLGDQVKVNDATPERALTRLIEVATFRVTHLIVDIGHLCDRQHRLLLPLVRHVLLVTTQDDIEKGRAQRSRNSRISQGLPRSRLQIVVNQVRPGPPLDLASLRRQCGAPILTALPHDPDQAIALWEERPQDVREGVGTPLDGLQRIIDSLY